MESSVWWPVLWWENRRTGWGTYSGSLLSQPGHRECLTTGNLPAEHWLINIREHKFLGSEVREVIMVEAWWVEIGQGWGRSGNGQAEIRIPGVYRITRRKTTRWSWADAWHDGGKLLGFGFYEHTMMWDGVGEKPWEAEGCDCVHCVITYIGVGKWRGEVCRTVNMFSNQGKTESRDVYQGFWHKRLIKGVDHLMRHRVC